MSPLRLQQGNLYIKTKGLTEGLTVKSVQEYYFESKIQHGIDRGSSGGIEDTLLRSRDNPRRPQNRFDRYLAGQRELFL